MEFANRAEWPFSTNELTLLRQAKEAKGLKILDLTQSNPTRCGFSFYKAGDWLKALSDPKNLNYDPDPRGLLAAREAVCAYYAAHKTKVRPDQVFLTAGTSEAYGHIFRLMANPGDAALVPKPSYPLFDFLAQIHDVKLKPFGSEKGKLAIFVNPNNPTGHYTRPEIFDRAKKLCAGGAVIADEVFLDFPFDGKKPGKSFAGAEDMLTFTLSGVSKILALPQMKLAWIVVSGPDKEREEAMRRLEIISDTALSVSAPAQNALPAWLLKRKSVSDEIRARIHSNRKTLAAHFPRGGQVELMDAEAGWYSVLKINGEADEEKIAVELLGRHQVFAHPGYFFDFEDGAHLVLSHIVPEAELREAAGRMVKYFHG